MFEILIAFVFAFMGGADVGSPFVALLSDLQGAVSTFLTSLFGAS